MTLLEAPKEKGNNCLIKLTGRSAKLKFSEFSTWGNREIKMRRNEKLVFYIIPNLVWLFFYRDLNFGSPSISQISCLFVNFCLLSCVLRVSVCGVPGLYQAGDGQRWGEDNHRHESVFHNQHFISSATTQENLPRRYKNSRDSSSSSSSSSPSSLPSSVFHLLTSWQNARAVTVPLILFPVRFGSVFQQKPRFRFGSVFSYFSE